MNLISEHEVKIRLATTDDAARLLEIYAPYIEDTAITMEFVVPTVEEFKGRIEKILTAYPYLVLEEDGIIQGYAYAGRFRTRAAFDWAVETSIYLAPEGKGKGYGRMLYAKLEEILCRQNVRNVDACISYPYPESTHLDDNSIRFHAHMGYTTVGIFKNSCYKFGQWYGLIWMEKLLGDHPKDMPALIPFPELLKKEGVTFE